MAVFFSLLVVVFLIYFISKSQSRSEKLKELTQRVKKLEDRIIRLELNQFAPKKEENKAAQKEVEKELEKTSPPEVKTDIPAEVPTEIKTEDLPFIVTEVDDIVNEEKVEEEIEEKVEAEKELKVSELAFKVTEEKPTESPIPEKEKEKPEVTAPKFERPTESAKFKSYHTTAAPRPIQVQQPPLVKKKENEFWTKIEKQFVENWTGILGSVIMVVGVGFLGVYAALKISALGRFLLISGFAAALGGLFFYLHKKPEWLKLALWLRSSAGAIFLFACAGSIAIPGLKWVETEPMQLLILSLGVVVNLFLGYVGKNQGLASLHVLLSLVGVWILPSSPMTLVVAGVVALFGVALTYREKWDYHLLLTISSFFAFHLLYWFSLNHVISTADRIYGIATVLSVGIAVALVHYREAYSKKTFERTPFIVHLVNWFYFALSLYLYSNGSRVSTFVLAVGSIAAYFLSRRAKKLDIRWLALTDSLIAQVTAIVALLTLSRWQVDQSIILATIFIEGLLFLFIAKKENDLLLYKIGSVAINLIGIVLLFYCFATFSLVSNSLMYNHAGSLLAAAAVGTVFLFYSNKSNTMDVSGFFKSFEIKLNEKTKHPILSIIIGALFVTYYSQLFEFNWSIYTVVPLLAVLLYFRQKLQSTEFTFITTIFLVGSHAVNWFALYELKDRSYLELLVVGLPILAASVLSVKYSFVKTISKYFNWIGVYLFSIQLLLLSYFLLNPISILAVSCGWLLLSLFAIVIVNLISKKSSQFHQIERYILHVGYVLIGLFLMRHLYYNLNFNEVWGPMKGRIWVELLAFFVFLVWAIAKNKENATYNSWKYLQPLFVELIILFSFFSLTFELNYHYLSLTWLGMAGITFVLANWISESLGRLAVYSFTLFLLSLIQEIYIYSTVHFNTGNNSAFPTQDFIIAAVFILLSFSYLLVFYKRAQLVSVKCPDVLSGMTALGEKLQNSAAFIGVYFYAAFLVLITYFMFANQLVVSCGWLLLSLLAIVIVNFISKKSTQFHQIDRYILHVGYVLIGLFFVRFVLFNLTVDELWGPMKARIWIELFAALVFLVWAVAKNKENSSYKSWKYLQPLFVELIVLFSFSSLTFELDYHFLALTWLGMAIIIFGLAKWKYETLGRLALYSFGFFLLSLIQQIFIYSKVHMLATNTLFFPTQDFIFACVYVLLSLSFLIVFYKQAKLRNFNCPAVLVDLNALGENLQKYAASIGVYFYGVFLLLISYFMFAYVSEIIPGVIWLILSAVIATLSLYFYQKRSNILYVDRYMLHISYLFIVAFLIRHILVHIQIESYVGAFKVRFLIEVLAMSVFTYCATLKKPETTTYKSWDYLHPLLIEVLILFSIFTVALEVDGTWQPLIWVAMSFVFAITGNSKYKNISRLLFYSLIMYWVTALQTAFITSTYVVPSNEVFAQPWVYGTLSLLFQFAFLLYFYLKCSFEKITLPKSLQFLSELIEKIDKSRNTYVFYPLIICTAIFLFWTFDKSVLTLLWVIECLAIFMVSLILKKQHFRYVALGALALCIVRLIFFDLAQSSTLTRAIVFLSVGIIMLVMNSLYNKFKSRFE